MFVQNLKPLFFSILIAFGQRNTTFAAAKVQIFYYILYTSSHNYNII